MKHASLVISFFLALSMAIFGTVLFPNFRLIAFAPFLAIIYTRTTFITSLWAAFACGLIIDLMSSQFRFGIYALNYCLTTVMIYKQKRHFFDDKPLALSIFTTAISSTSTLLQLLLLYVFDNRIPFSWKLVIADLVGMPVLDGAYAFLWFTCMIKLFHYIKKVEWRRLFTKKQES